MQQENAIDRFSSIEEYAATCDDLSDADMLQRWHDSSVDQTALLCSLQVAGQSVLLRNTTPAASKFSACRMTQWSQLSRAQSWQIDVRQAMARVALVWPSLRTALADAMLEIVPTARWLTRMRDPSRTAVRPRCALGGS